jgi:DUF1680 family protein
MAGATKIKLPNQSVTLKVDTNYPWDGAVKIIVEPENNSTEFAVNLRIPGWAKGEPVPGSLYKNLEDDSEDVKLMVNGRVASSGYKNGYAQIVRRWKSGDVIELDLPMRVRRVVCDVRVESNRGKVALERGPIVYCAEWFDNGGKVENLSVSDEDQFDVKYRKDALGGINVLSRVGKQMLAIPYYAWAHRGEGQMKVWFDRKTREE